MFTKHRYSTVYIYKGGHEAWPGYVDGWTKTEALATARARANQMPVIPRDVQLLHDFGVIETWPTIGEVAS